MTAQLIAPVIPPRARPGVLSEHGCTGHSPPPARRRAGRPGGPGSWCTGSAVEASASGICCSWSISNSVGSPPSVTLARDMTSRLISP